MISLEKERAAAAWTSTGGGVTKEYRSLVRSFPSMIQSMGIGAAIAVLMSDITEPAHAKLLRDLETWAFGRIHPIPWTTPVIQNGRLMRQLTMEPPEVWWVASKELIAYAVWLKQLAQVDAVSGGPQ